MQIDVTGTLRDPARLSALHRLGVMDTSGEEAFDRLVRLATRFLDVPSSTVLFMDDQRQFFKSVAGIPEPWATRRVYPACDSICQYTVATGEAMVVEDARKHPLTCDLKVVSDFDVAGYLGVPLVTKDGHAVGTFCVTTSQPRRWHEDDVQVLADLAASAMTEIEMSVLAQEAQSQQQERETILERIRDGFFALDREWRFTYVNQGLEQLAQRSRDELLGKTIWEEFPAALNSNFESEYRRALSEQIPTSFQAYYEPYNRWFRAHAYPSADGLSVYYEDVTDRKRLEDLLNGQIHLLEMVATRRDLNEILESLLRMVEAQSDGMIGSILLLDNDGRFRNGAGANLPPAYGQKLDGVPIESEFGPCAVAVKQRTAVEVGDIAGLRKWTGFRDLALTHGLQACWSTPIFSADNQVLGSFAMYYREPRTPTAWDRQLLEITTHVAGLAISRARSEEMLRFLGDAGIELATSIDYDALLQEMAQTMIPRLASWCIVDIVEEDGSIRRVATATTEPEHEEVLDELQHRYPPSGVSMSPAAQVLRSGQPLLVEEVTDEWVQAHAIDAEHLALIRSLKPRSAIAVPLLSGGKALGAITLIRTVPFNHYTQSDLVFAQELALRAVAAIENARLYRQAQLALHTRDQFLSVAAHELKTPITSLLGYAQLIERRARRDRVGNKRNMRPVRALIDQAQRLHRLSTLLLDLSRIQVGTLTIEQAPVDLLALVQQVVEDMRLTLVRHTIEVEVASDGVSPIVEGDELRLEQVLYNLLQNAIKYSPDGGPITVQLQGEGDHVSVAVTDHGIGIPSDALPNLFNRFYRADNVNEKQFSGMGLGLFVVKEIIARHDGTLDVDSVKDEGSTFTVRLPVASSPEM